MNPRTRPLEVQPIHHDGQPAYLIRDRLGLSEHALVIPRPLGLLLAFCDGTHDIATIQKAVELGSGLRLETSLIEHLLQQLDEAFLLDTPRAAAAEARALEEYRSALYRPPSCAGQSYPAAANELRDALEGYLAKAQRGNRALEGAVRGIVSPHIDFERGWPVYAATWPAAQDELQNVEVIVVFGTDHAGPVAPRPPEEMGFGEVTLTRQNYYTPLGVLPTCREIVDFVAESIGYEQAFANELNHRKEHSIELALVWLQYFLGENRPQIVPVLCGSFHRFTQGDAEACEHEPLSKFLGSLSEALAGRKHLVVAAADLAHVGPVFGDSFAFGATEKDWLQKADASLMAAASSGDAETFLQPLVTERDRRRVCGLPPIYLTLRLLGQSRGEVLGYAQCAADEKDASWVSICGMLFS